LPFVSACAPESWNSCAVDLQGLPSCVENGSTWQQSADGFDDCEGAGGTPMDGGCKDNGYACGGGGPEGLYVTSDACPAGEQAP
jgi:hypothetical protein